MDEKDTLMDNQQQENSNPVDDTVIIRTDEGAKNGQDKCPLCGATDISLNQNTGKLRCNFCRHEFEPEALVGMQEELSSLKGKVISSGAQNIEEDAEDVLTLKCQSCGAEVVIDTSESAQARCHWCRNTLSINKQIPNGSIPDVVLPFSIKKEDAKQEIEKFVAKRKFFAHPTFRKEFTTENIMGVYLPYMLVDVNGHAYFEGEGERLVRRYEVGGSDDKKEYRYDADLYHVSRKFDIEIKKLSIESSADKLDKKNKKKTTNIINSIMPFDTENCVKWNANYLKGYTSERRDVNVDQLEHTVIAQATDVAKFKANSTLEKYDRGVRWEQKKLEVEGQQWKAAYLPVWLYSFQEKKGNNGILHYIAVNARTKETMGSVPIHIPKLVAVSILVEILGILTSIFVNFEDDSAARWALLLAGFIFFALVYFYYRNSDARHSYETETVSKLSNLVSTDDFVKHETGLSNAVIKGCNNESVDSRFD